MKKKVFISGPILGMETNQGYREIITEICERIGFEVIDPWRREKNLYKGDELWWWPNVPAEGFVQRDLEDAELCDIMVVYLPKLSAGACMELFYAKRKGKKIIVVSGMESLSPWIKIHSDATVKNFKELKEALKKI
ncbi:MAG: nucleoside 2-deoxyribosyltransferase domain-containing protein [Candidatus Bathyarchaeia archaeon]